MRHLFIFLLVLFLSGYTYKTRAQIVVSPTAGCMPVGLTNATFNYLGPTASSLTWNFGDGSPTSSLFSPQHSYLTVGPKTVVCTAIVGGSPQTFTFLVQVFPQPSGGIAAPQTATSGCAPRSATWSATSNNPNYTYSWAFGDNGGGTGAVVTHAYASQGTWYPTLTIIDNQTSCSIAYTWTQTGIHVSSLPSIVFTASATYSCTAPLITTISGSLCGSNSPIPGPLVSYLWNFGNSTSGTGTTPPPVNYGTGLFVATLTVTDNNNCTNVGTQQISVYTPTLQVVVPPAVCVASQMPSGPAPNNMFGPNTPTFFVGMSTTETVALWNMGDNTPIKQFPPNNLPLTPNVMSSYSFHTYYTPGLKIGTVSVSAGTCVATQTFAIFVEQITPNFTLAPHVFTCSPSIVANYTNLSVSNFTSPLTYTWYAQQWNPLYNYTSTATNPTFTFTQGSNSPYTIYDTYKPKMYLMVKSGVGCEAMTSQIFDSIRRPTAFFNVYKNEGCAPLAITLLDSSFTDVNIFPITSYTWYSGAGPSQTLTGNLVPPAMIPNFNYTYTTPGVYHPYLQIQTQGGCSSTSYLGTITVVNPPNIAMSLTPNLSVCAGQSVQVNLTTTTNPPPQHLHVHSGENYFSGCVSDPSPIWAYHTPGVYGFTVVAYLNSCSVVAVPVQTILVKGPSAALQYSTNCTDKFKVDFKHALRDVQSATLNFGASANSTIFIPGSPGNTLTGLNSYTYPSTGNYTASITGVNASNGCGPYTQTALVTVRQASAAFSFSPVVCKDNYIFFVAQTFTDNVVGCGVGYAWYVDNAPPMLFSKDTMWLTNPLALGIHTITLRVKDGNSCVDTARSTFRVTNPVPTFTFNSNPVCFSNYPAQLFNFTPQTPDAVNNFTWMYGPHGSTSTFPQSVTVVNGVATQSVHFTMGPGAVVTQTFDVKLIAEDVNGCIDSVRHRIRVNQPEAILTQVTSTCSPPTVSQLFFFVAQPTYTNYFLNFGPNSYSVSTSNSVVAITFTNTGIFNPTLTITDNAGCTSTDTMLHKFEIQLRPIPDFTFQTTLGLVGNSFCIPRASAVTLSLTSTSNTFHPAYYRWDNGITPIASTTNSFAVHSYTAGITYTLGLTLAPANLPAGCWATKTLVVNMYNQPLAEAVVNKTVFCMGESLLFTLANDTAVHHWQWDFGDNQPTSIYNQTHPKTIAYNYPPNFFPSTTNGNILIIVTFSSPFDICENIDTLRVKMIRILPDFKRNDELDISDYAHCLGVPDTFSNTSTSNASFLSYNWSFGDGNTSTAANPNYTYPFAGNFVVTLLASDVNVGCTKSITKTMTVFPLPSANFTIEDLACPDSLFMITGSGLPGISGILTGTISNSVSSYSVSFNAGNSFSFQTSAPATTIYSLQVSDDNNCKNSPLVDSIRIQLPPPSQNTSTSVIIGQTVTLNGFVGNNYTYTWINDTSNLSCTNCYNPVSTVTNNTTYTVSVSDLPLKCFAVHNLHDIIIILKGSIDVPTAFTPNNDGINDIIIPSGWGIRKLNYFKVYNRWGQLLFESTDLKNGWDGTFNSIPQNMETYIYQASVETLTDETFTKSGSFKLIR